MPATPTENQLLTTTLQNRHKEIADNVTNSNALLSVLKKNGNHRSVDGGTEILCPLVYAEEDFKWYSGNDELSRNLKDVISQAKYEPAQAVASITLTGGELAKNRGSNRLFSLMSSRIDNAANTLENQIGAGIYGDGSVEDSMIGLAALIADDPTTGVIGGIDAATFEFWRNQLESVAASGLTFEALTAKMRKLYRKTTRKKDKPTLILADETSFDIYEEGLTANQRYADESTANHGFTTLKFKQSNVVYEGDDVGHPGGMFFINPKYFKFETYKGRNFQPLDLNETTPDQDAITKHLGFMGALTCSNRSLQGRLLLT